MKIAVGFSGQPRFYKETFPIFKKLIFDRYETDIYCHSWWSEEEVKKGMSLSWSSSISEFALDPDFPNQFESLYKPKKFLIEKSLLLKEENLRDNFYKRVKELYPQYNINYLQYPDSESFIHKFISTERLSNIVNWEENYDWFFLCRFDCVPSKIPDLNKLEKQKLYSFIDDFGTFSKESTIVNEFPNQVFYNDGGYFFDPGLKDILNTRKFLFDYMAENKNVYTLTPEFIKSLHLKYLNWNDKLVSLPSEEFNMLIVRNMNEIKIQYEKNSISC